MAASAAMGAAILLARYEGKRELMADRAVERVQQLNAELLALFAQYDLSDFERAELLELERRGGWRPGARPTRPEPNVTAFLNFFDRAEQEELTDRTLTVGSVDELRRVFREHLEPDA
jgi:hypothetical protein